MERLKYILSKFALLIALLCSITACEETGIDQSEDIDMSNEFSTLSFSGETTSDGSEKIVIITTIGSWTASTAQEWIHLSAESGTSGKSSFYVSVDGNNDSSTRYGTIEIKSGNSRRTIVVEQLHYQYIDVSSTSFSYDGREHTFSVIASTNIAAKNVEVSMSSDAAKWITYSAPTQTEIDDDVVQLKYTFEIPELGDELTERDADVVFSYSKIGVGNTINISQSAYPTLSIETQPQQLSYYDTTCVIDVVSNVDVVVEIPEGNDWITLDEEYVVSGTTKSYSFTIEQNGESTLARDCDVKVAYYAKNEITNISEEIVELTKSVNVEQLGKVVAVSFVDEDKYTQTQSYILNENFEVSLYSNVELTAVVESSWVSIVGEPTVQDSDEIEGNGDDKIYTFTLKLEQNESAENSREETIYFTNTIDESKNTSIKITQDKEQPFIAIECDDELPYDANNSFQIVVTANDETAPTVSGNDSWISQSGEATKEDTNVTGVYKYTYTFNVESNFYVGASYRTSNITFTATSASDTVAISQGSRVPIVTIDNESDVTASHIFNVGSVTINVTSDIELTEEMSGQNSWTIQSKTNATGYEYVVTIPDNDVESVQTATVTLSNTDYKYSKELIITQEAMPTTYTLTGYVTGNLASSSVENPENYSRIVISGEALNADDFALLKSSFTSLAYIDISATVTTEIPASQFASNTTLKQILLPSTLETIGASAFSGSGLLSVTIPSSVSTVGDSAFSSTKSLESVIFEEGVKAIGSKMFHSATVLNSIKFATTIEEVGVNAFESTTALTSVDLDGLKVIGYRMFYSSGLTTVTIPSTIETWIGNPDDTTGYPTNMGFQNNSSLVTVELEAGLKTLASAAFSNCAALLTMTSYALTPPELILPSAEDGYYPMNAGSLTKTIYVYEEAMDDYKAANGWIRHATKYVSIESLTE